MTDVIIDSALSLEEALAGTQAPQEILNDLVLLDIPYVSFDDQIHQGQIIVHITVADEVKTIFGKLLEIRFPIHQMKLPVVLGWDDDESMAQNNTSGFNYRIIHGTDQLSNHSYGFAIDINPALNPYTRRDGVVMPEGATYDPNKLGTLTADGPVVTLFKSYGWDWGGDWERKDWQHFAKPKTV